MTIYSLSIEIIKMCQNIVCPIKMTLDMTVNVPLRDVLSQSTRLCLLDFPRCVSLTATSYVRLGYLWPLRNSRNLLENNVNERENFSRKREMPLSFHYSTVLKIALISILQITVQCFECFFMFTF